jgi:S-adenosylmethionine:tRNA ribosyltransferase-isomerase
MKRSELQFDRPEHLAAVAPVETRGLARDQVRLMVSTPRGHVHARFSDLPDFLLPGDLLVVNRSATLAASLPAAGRLGTFILNLSSSYGGGLWLAEPRWDAAHPGPLPLERGEWIDVDGVRVRLVEPFPGLPRLWFIHTDGDLQAVMRRAGRPIHYGYVQSPPDLSAYQTIFASVPGSVEMPSAARPFTCELLDRLSQRGVRTASIVLHTGVSSLEVESEEIEAHPLYPEPFHVPGWTARLVNEARAKSRRVIAVGTTVVRALESAWDGNAVQPGGGFTRLYVEPRRGVHAIDGLLTGMHDPVTSHLAMLYALAGKDFIQDAYAEAVREGYLWHEFGDSHLILND